ncbi:nucleoside diphosphate kinase, mitochondrial-like isoform X1 [Corvus moneduloides]|uniref:Nucleoside diphosphate kinase n=1 Tax=Corvus moneduloides TaxID=1196302 RepID=A0A8U7N966_CORMO|nr:nucleoside diphosphate kinase, mitochondrial-like isoform X1 [Corvus moneduloides]XP_031981849.1 nucleoside diphosphate kinase, mitochondrial-like isoform X1 [Corvus moneduloides]XP_031981850.1 nucleoside diphosphate kinase, mitochondrial-like isoform X1 [Corvus moneduloides]
MGWGQGRGPSTSRGAAGTAWAPAATGAVSGGVPCPAVVTVTRGPPAAPPALQEKTLVVAKPDAVQRRLLGDIIRRFERRGFKLVAMKLLQADRRLVEQHYEQLRLKPFYPALVAYMTSGPVVAMVWEGYNAVRCVRAMVGDSGAVGTIRGDLSVHITRNLVHASDSVETAQREIGFWFPRDELVAWDSRDRDNIYGL